MILPFKSIYKYLLGALFLAFLAFDDAQAEDIDFLLNRAEHLSLAEPHKAIDQLKQFRETNSIDELSKRFALDFLIFNIYLKVDDLINLRRTYTQMRQDYGDKTEISHWLALADALVFFTDLKTDKAQLALKPHLDLYSKTESAELKMWSSFVLGVLYSKQNRFDSAMENLNEAMELARSLGNHPVRLFCLSNLINIFYYMQDYDRAEEFNAQLLDAAKFHNDKFLQARALSANINIVYMKIYQINAQMKEANDNQEPAHDLEVRKKELLKTAETLGDKLLKLSTEIGAHKELIRYYISKQLQYMDRRDYQTALTYINKAIEIATVHHYDFEKAVSYNNKALSYQALKEHEKGLEALEKAAAIYKKLDNDQFNLWVLEDYSRAYEAKEDYKKALEYRKKHHGEAIKLLKKTNSESVLDIQEKYDAARKQQEIDKLNQKNALNESKISNQRMQILMVAGFMTAFLVILVMQINRSKVIANKNAKLDALNSQLKDLSFKDPLTGLYNRRMLKEAEKKIAHNSMRRIGNNPEIDSRIGIIIFDIDLFKQINDRYGHDVGDFVIKEVGSKINRRLREGDLAFRWGGEEFLVILFQINPAGIEKFCRDILSEMNCQELHFRQTKLKVTCSLGFSLFPFACDNPTWLTWEESLKLIDNLLYVAKDNGRNQAVGLEFQEPHYSEENKRAILDSHSENRKLPPSARFKILKH